METVKVKINTHGGPCPEQHGEWIDLATAEEAVLKKGEFKLISLGVSMDIPQGWYAEIAPRSSAYTRYRVIMANSCGIIENEYHGDNDIWRFPAVALEDTHIPKGVRLCQFRLHRTNPRVEFIQVETLGNADRGGFGSTGV